MPVPTKTTTLLIIGGGPGGYVAAIRAAQLGVATMLVEGDTPGGTCLNIGCIPSKALIHAADEFDRVRRATPGAASSPLGIRAEAASIDLAVTQAWKDGVVGKLTGGVAALLRKAGVQVVRGWARIVDGKTVDVDFDGAPLRLQCEHLLLATGSEPMALPQLPFGGNVLSSTEALALAEVPRHLVVVGAGYIGLELGMAWRKLGAEVTIVDVAERVLPGYDEDLGKPVLAALKRLGIVLHLGCTAEGLTADGAGLRVRSRHADEFVLPADKVLVAAGRRPRTAGLETLQLDMAGRAVKVDSSCRTSMRNVWAIGDLTGEPMLAHRAMAQGEVVAECVAGHKRQFAPLAIPAVCFTDPEVVAVGQTQAQAEQAGIEAIVSSFPFAANGRSLTMEGGEGFVRVVARKDNHLVLGWQAVGAGVSELAAAFSYAIEIGARLEDVGGIIHAHPTLGEAVQEAALRALGRAIHL
ncbi:MAG: dihydrolipoyl dehydrogenase [Comamonadaceae bacterium]|nr:MAG: dihydrolipoyl dehydrogenase [Comamonadaceae bacterium]